MSTTTTKPKQYTLLLLGDLQLGRLIDALLPTSIARQSPHTDPENAAETVDKYFLPRHRELREYGYASPWGNWLDILRTVRRDGEGRRQGGVDLVLANLETALTVGERKWEGKVFNYRSHPQNVNVLLEAGFRGAIHDEGGQRRTAATGDGDDVQSSQRTLEEGYGKQRRNGARGYVSLANNHTLDWSISGLHETIRTLDDAGIAYAGAGRDAAEAARPAVLILGGAAKGEREWEVHCWSFSDHPSDWSVPGFNLIDYTPQSREIMRKQILAQHPAPNDHKRQVGLKVVSLHWGPNYRWSPSPAQISLAHYLIDECGIDIIHGHSAHHIQGVEIYKGKLIIYGCGDFVDDYAVVAPGREGEWRNDLSGGWRVSVGEREGGEGLRVRRLEVVPNRIKLFQAERLEVEDEDHEWVQRKVRKLCKEFGTKVEDELGEGGEIVIDLEGQ